MSSLPTYRSPKFLGDKYRIYDRDCNPCDTGDYFVLRLDPNGENREHYIASMKAAAAYARYIKNTEYYAVGARLQAIVRARQKEIKREALIREVQEIVDEGDE